MGRERTGTAAPTPKPRRTNGSTTAIPADLFHRVVRVVSFLFIVSVLFIETVTGAPRPSVYALMAVGAFGIVLFQDLLPLRILRKWRLRLEAGAAIVFITVLVIITGGYMSPYFLGYLLVLGAASLWASGYGPTIIALVTAAAYLVAIFVSSGLAVATPDEAGRVAFNLIALGLVTYLAGVIGREQRHAREEALRLSRFDSMTGLHSRDYFQTAVDQEILRASRTGRQFGLVMIDLDGLKAANDRFGHQSGDRLLQAVADVLRGDVRATDIAARYGGDEFVLMLPETDLPGALRVADKVRVDIARLALAHEGALIRTSASVGVVTFPDDGRAAAELMRRADLAMYEAKRRGRDQVVRYAREVNVPMGASAAAGQYTRRPAPMSSRHSPPWPPSQTSPTDNAPPTATGPPIGQPDAASAAPASAPAEVQPAAEPQRVVQAAPPPATVHAGPPLLSIPPESPHPAPWEKRGG